MQKGKGESFHVDEKDVCIYLMERSNKDNNLIQETKAVSQYTRDVSSCLEIHEQPSDSYFPGKILEVSKYMRQVSKIPNVNQAVSMTSHEIEARKFSKHHSFEVNPANKETQFPVLQDTKEFRKVDQHIQSHTNLIDQDTHVSDEENHTLQRQWYQHLYLDLENTNEDTTVVAEYELLHRIHEFLGLMDSHQFDYAYRPVWIPLYHGEQEMSRRNNHNYIQGTSPTWFTSTNTQSRFRRDYDTENKYERVGNTAFAGGSHGEVWRARRRCNQMVTYEPILTSSESMTDHSNIPSSSSHTVCDDKVDLIMKRLKVEHGFDILEAGMREVYFGQLLMNQPKLFTHYVDHFFHKAHRGAEPELWIVFENAGVSLRSLLYTPLETEDFFVYRQSDFWRRLRRIYTSDKTSDGTKAVSESDGSASSISSSLNVDGSWTSSTRTQEDTNTMQSFSLTAIALPQLVATMPNTQELPDPTNVPFLGNAPNSLITHKLDSSEYRFQRSTTKRRRSSRRENVTFKKIMKQLLVSTAALHELGIIHRDIKPSNIMCKLVDEAPSTLKQQKNEHADIFCRLGDFSSAWDRYGTRTLYTFGPTAAEQTDDYAPPEVLFGETYIPFDPKIPESYDSWSIGVVALELILGTPHVFSVDQRTTTLLTSRMEREGATMEQIHQALYLSALSQFCIYNPSQTSSSQRNCSLQDFHRALRARDPLGIGLDSSTDNDLLDLIWGLLAWEPKERLLPKDALHHRYFATKEDNHELIPANYNALEEVPTVPLIVDPNNIHSFICPGCGRSYENLNSCTVHARSRRHAYFCKYDTSSLPTCLNYHHMLPNHPTSGYCDIQGRRRVIEDFHSIHLKKNHQYYGIFDGHNGNLASKYASSFLYSHIIGRIRDVDESIRVLFITGLFLKYLFDITSFNSHHNMLLRLNENTTVAIFVLLGTLEIFLYLYPIISDMIWKSAVEGEIVTAFQSIHLDILDAIKNQPDGNLGTMSKSGTTATVLFIFQAAIVIANVGDSSAVLSIGDSNRSVHFNRDDIVSHMILTVDHVASDQDEQKMVKAKGGSIMYSGGIERVEGELAITRSLGDPHLMQYLSRTPHVISFSMDEIKRLCKFTDSMPCFIVLASDGLWDVMSPHEAIIMVQTVIESFESWEEGGAFQHAAQVLTHEAYVRGSTDNIGICIVALPLG